MKTKLSSLALILIVSVFASSLTAQSIIGKDASVIEIWTDHTEEGSDPWYAVDGDESTAWQTVNTLYNPEIEFELDDVYTIIKTVMKWGGMYGAQPWDIYSSIDGTYQDESGKIMSICHKDECQYSETVIIDEDHEKYQVLEGQYIKLQFRGRVLGEGSYYLVKEFEMYGTKAGDSKVQKINIINLKTYPNPVNDVLNIAAETEIECISVMDLNGREIENHSMLKSNNYTLSTNNWESGTYLVKIITKEGSKVERVIK